MFLCFWLFSVLHSGVNSTKPYYADKAIWFPQRGAVFLNKLFTWDGLRFHLIICCISCGSSSATASKRTISQILLQPTTRNSRLSTSMLSSRSSCFHCWPSWYASSNNGHQSITFQNRKPQAWTLQPSDETLSSLLAIIRAVPAFCDQCDEGTYWGRGWSSPKWSLGNLLWVLCSAEVMMGISESCLCKCACVRNMSQGIEGRLLNTQM